MKKKASLLWVVPLALVVMLIAGCGGSDTGSTLTPTSPRTTSSVPGTSAAVTPDQTEAPAVGVHCGTERWPVKTLSDTDAASINFSATQTTVAELRSLSAPATLPQSSRVTPTELTTYSLTAQVKEFKLEDDQDIHLVIADPSDSSQTMITEFPDATQCSGAVGSAHASEMIAARQALVAAFGQPSSSHFTTITGTATISGVAFFDFKHGQTGVAPNAIELHPVLSFSTSSTEVVPVPHVLTPRPSVNASNEYACEGSDCNCSDFPSHAEAQRIFEKHGGSPTNNWSRLDADHDGVACESLR